jgi:hypothetical protein
MSRRMYLLNVAGPEIGNSLVREYTSKKELRSRYLKDAADFVARYGSDTAVGDWYPYFQIEYLGGELDGELEEVSWRELFGTGRTGKRRAA